MKARLVLALGATLLATIGVAGSNQAAAGEAVPTTECVATGTTQLGVGIGLPPAGTRANVSFSITATCLNGGTISASGTLATASCGRSVGSGTITRGSVSRPFQIETAGGTFVVTGPGVAGAGQVVADPTIANNSCLNNTARFFRTTGAVNFV